MESPSLISSTLDFHRTAGSRVFDECSRFVYDVELKADSRSRMTCGLMIVLGCCSVATDEAAFDVKE